MNSITEDNAIDRILNVIKDAAKRGVIRGDVSRVTIALSSTHDGADVTVETTEFEPVVLEVP